MCELTLSGSTPSMPKRSPPYSVIVMGASNCDPAIETPAGLRVGGDATLETNALTGF
ncbi:MAG: hypothetical protein WKH64_10470 [Chloroflexia bacterium]